MSVLTFTAQLSLDFVFSHLEKMPSLGEEVLSPEFTIQLGGGTLVYPVVLTRLGLDCRVIVKASSSLQGDIALGLLKSKGIKNLEVIEEEQFDPVMSTAVLSFVHDRSFVSKNDHRALLFDEDFLYEHLKDSKVVFATEQTPQLLSRLKEQGCTVVFDVGWSDTMSLDTYTDIFPFVDYFTPNDKEALKLTGASTVEESLMVLKKLVPHPIVSCGEAGCLTFENDSFFQVDVPVNTAAVDTTGAGDNFMAGLIYGINEEWPVIESMKLANCTGALSTEGYGCYGAEYTLEQAVAKMKDLKVTVSPQ